MDSDLQNCSRQAFSISELISLIHLFLVVDRDEHDGFRWSFMEQGNNMLERFCWCDRANVSKNGKEGRKTVL